MRMKEDRVKVSGGDGQVDDAEEKEDDIDIEQLI